MAIPSPIKIKKNGVEYVSNVEYLKYSIFELTCAALRDVGKLVCRRFKGEFYRTFKKRSGKTSSFCQYWVRKNKKYQDTPDLWIGLKGGAFYGIYQEIGTETQPKLGILKKVTMDNLAEIQKIEAKYLTSLKSEDPLSYIKGDLEKDYTGGADD